MKSDLHPDIGSDVAVILVLAQYQGHSCARERDHVLIVVHVADGEVEACRRHELALCVGDAASLQVDNHKENQSIASD